MYEKGEEGRKLLHLTSSSEGFPGGSDGKASACSAGDLGSIPGSGISPGEGNGNPVQYSCLGNPMDRGAWVPGKLGSGVGPQVQQGPGWALKPMLGGREPFLP